MKIKFQDHALVVSFSGRELVDQLLAVVFATAFLGGIFWYAPEQMGW